MIAVNMTQAAAPFFQLSPPTPKATARALRSRWFGGGYPTAKAAKNRRKIDIVLMTPLDWNRLDHSLAGVHPLARARPFGKNVAALAGRT
jgi:hypothetical protein